MKDVKVGDFVKYDTKNEYVDSLGFVLNQSYPVVETNGFLAAYCKQTNTACIFLRQGNYFSKEKGVMTNKERYEKLKKAQELIREVEFSYKEGEEPRRLLYRFVVYAFSVTGILNGYLTELKETIRKEEKDPYYT